MFSYERGTPVNPTPYLSRSARSTRRSCLAPPSPLSKILDTAPCTLHPAPYTLHSAPRTLHPTPYTLHPAPHILHPSHHTLHPESYTLYPISQERAVNAEVPPYYRGTSLIRNSALLGPYSKTMHRALWWVLGWVAFL